MTRSRRLDLTPLFRPVGLGDRLRTIGANPLTVLGLAIGVLLVVVPLIVVVALFATGNATDVGGLAVLALLLAGGAWVVGSELHKAGADGAFGSFARVNHLTLVRATAAPEYAGSQFADGSHVVLQSVRTRRLPIVEVGDRFPVTSVGVAPSPIGGVTAARQNRPEVFLRAQLAGPAAREPQDDELVTPELHERLTRFAGPYTIEVSGDELTFFGSRALDTAGPGRVEEAFDLADELADRANAALVPEAHRTATLPFRYERPDDDRPAPYLPGGRQPKRSGWRGRPAKVVALGLAFLVGGTLVIAVGMSVLDDVLGGNRLAVTVVVAVIVVVVFAVAARIARTLTARRRADAAGRDRLSPRARAGHDGRPPEPPRA